LHLIAQPMIDLPVIKIAPIIDCAAPG